MSTTTSRNINLCGYKTMNQILITKPRHGNPVRSLGWFCPCCTQTSLSNKRSSREFDPSTASLYIAILSAISTLSSMYGMLVIFRAAKEYMKPRRLGLKFFAIKLTVIILNIQTQIFGLLAKFDVLPCKLSRGGKIRASNMKHGVLIIETFLIALLARYAYRRREPDIEGTIVDKSALDRDGIQIGVDSECCINSDNECLQNGDDEKVPDLGVVCKYSGTDNVAYTVSL